MNIKNIKSASFLLGRIEDYRKKVHFLEDMLDYPHSCSVSIMNLYDASKPITVNILCERIENELKAIISKEKEYLERRIAEDKKKIEEL